MLIITITSDSRKSKVHYTMSVVSAHCPPIQTPITLPYTTITGDCVFVHTVQQTFGYFLDSNMWPLWRSCIKLIIFKSMRNDMIHWHKGRSYRWMKDYNNLDWVTTTVWLTRIISFKLLVTGTSDVGLHLTVSTRKKKIKKFDLSLT